MLLGSSSAIDGADGALFCRRHRSPRRPVAASPWIPGPRWPQTFEMAPLVENAQIKHAQLLNPLPFQFRAYIWPFAIVWPIFLRYFLTPELYEKHIGAPEWTFVWVGSIVTVQSLVWLSTHWSVNLDSIFTAKSAKSVEDARLIKVIPIANAGSAEICKLVRDKVGAFAISNLNSLLILLL